MTEYDAIWKLMGNENFLDFIPTGSREICNPAPMDTDYDIVALITKNGWRVPEKFGFKSSNADEVHYDMAAFYEFECFRMGEINLIVTPDLHFFGLWKKATSIAKERNLLDKNDRIVLFDEIMYDPEDME
ncbi:MAG TPA: hypothetical protein VFM18_20235 [Methanosarcina sp.]|nr:hypothetical protein [Methanosarcina sp.]